MISVIWTNEYNLYTHTPHGVISYKCETGFAEAKQLTQYCDYVLFSGLCKSGCPNFGKKWSCPPFSPTYNKYTMPYKYIEVIMLSLEIRQMEYIKQNYLKIKAGNAILKSRVDKALRQIKAEDEGYISTGSCRLCKPCKRKKGEPCAHPSEKAFSFEALGINVSAVTEDFFDKKLQWYKKKNLPEYTCVVAGLLTNRLIKNDRIYSQLKIFA